jgi:hypothetical protein
METRKWKLVFCLRFVFPPPLIWGNEEGHVVTQILLAKIQKIVVKCKKKYNYFQINFLNICLAFQNRGYNGYKVTRLQKYPFKTPI